MFTFLFNRIDLSLSILNLREVRAKHLKGTPYPCGISGLEKNGSSGRIRTYNPPVNSRMLCH